MELQSNQLKSLKAKIYRLTPKPALKKKKTKKTTRARKKQPALEKKAPQNIRDQKHSQQKANLLRATLLKI